MSKAVIPFTVSMLLLAVTSACSENKFIGEWERYQEAVPSKQKIVGRTLYKTKAIPAKTIQVKVYKSGKKYVWEEDGIKHPAAIVEANGESPEQLVVQGDDGGRTYFEYDRQKDAIVWRSPYADSDTPKALQISDTVYTRVKNSSSTQGKSSPKDDEASRLRECQKACEKDYPGDTFCMQGCFGGEDDPDAPSEDY